MTNRTGIPKLATTQRLSESSLRKIESGIAAKTPLQLKADYAAIVAEGKTLMIDADTRALMTRTLEQSRDIGGNVASALTYLMVAIYWKFNERMSLPAATLASFTLMCYVLDFAKKSMGMKITSQLIDTCARRTASTVMSNFGVPDDQIRGMLAINP